MTTYQLAKCLAKGNGKTVEEAYRILERRQKDIGKRGYAYAFKRDSVMTYEKAEWLKNNGRLGGKM